MRDYELLLVIPPTLDPAAAVDLSKEISELIKAREGQVNATNVWGRRKLAYTIDNHTEATYILQKVQIAPEQLPDFEFNLKLNESLLRYMIVRDHQPSATELEDSEVEAEASPASETPEVSDAPVADAPAPTEAPADTTTAQGGEAVEAVDTPSEEVEATDDAEAATPAETDSTGDEANSEAS